MDSFSWITSLETVGMLKVNYVAPLWFCSPCTISSPFKPLLELTYFFNGAELIITESENHWIDPVGRGLKHHPIQPLIQPRRVNIKPCARSTCCLNPCRDRDSPTALGRLYQCLITLSLKKYFPTSILNLSWLRSKLCLLVLSLHTSEKRLPSLNSHLFSGSCS